MKKGKLFLCLLSSVLIFGCAQEGAESEEEEIVELPEEEPVEENTQEEEQVYEVELSDKLSDFQFSINDQVYELPSGLKEWKDTGWKYGRDDSTEALDGETFLEAEVLEDKDGSLFVDIINTDGEKKLLKDCYVGGVTLEAHEKSQRVYQLPGGILVGRSSMEEVTKAYGTPTDEYEEKDNIYITYEYGIYKQADFVFDIQEEILYKAVLKNYRDPEDENQEVSKEVPDIVKNYHTPEKLSEGINDFTVKYGGDFYKLPAPVSVFTKNGWKISEEGSDKIVKKGRHGYVTLERDGQTLYAVVNNYADTAVYLENSFVTNLHGDFDVTKVNIEIYKGISLGMAEETMTALLEGNTYKTKEDEKGISYYIYPNEGEQDFTRIFVDKELRLVREIELSYSPEEMDQTAGMQEEEPESVDAAVIYGDDEFPGEGEDITED